MHPGQSAAHAAKRLGHHWCQSSAVALPLPQQCHQHRLWPLARLWDWQEPRKWSCRCLPGKGLCVLRGEGSVVLMLLVQLGWRCFPAASSPAKGLTADLCSVNTALQIRTLQCPTLLLHIAEMTNMCSVIRVTAFYARNNAGSSGFS